MKAVALALVVAAVALGIARTLLRRRWELRRALEIMDEQYRRLVTEIAGSVDLDAGELDALSRRPPSWYVEHPDEWERY